MWDRNLRCTFFTCRPTRLLCIFMRAWISLGDPRESSQSLEKRSPNRRSWLQPPHSQVSCIELNSSDIGLSKAEGWADRRLVGSLPWCPFSSEGNDLVMSRPTPPFCRVCSCSCVSFSRILSSSWRRLASQPHPRNLPMLQAEATEWATPAASKAREKALSRKPGHRTSTHTHTTEDDRMHRVLSNSTGHILSVARLPKALTPVEDGVVVGQLAKALQWRTVPALVAELVLAFVDGHLDALQCRCCHIRVPHTHPHLTFTEACQPQTHRVRG